ncbi:hypothetical protein KDL01_32885 [Actinospica durhamensis]|uniref:DUF1963 domain-containing protein n=1 Tax=Actinospica durhamensis TaxID=1508375 RepID=A0A941ETL2_9ACTN|nr:hypothetical protein [Actinospica durhamensis]MBR7838115.1 hypothetical protein [Actinospica durhamensis]
MVRVTPPRPLDITSVFPELAGLSATAVRLHPRPGKPTEWDSSVGGPILWPPDEPWPTCQLDHGPFDQVEISSPADIRETRRLLEAAASAHRSLTEQEQDELEDNLEDHRARSCDSPDELEFPLLPLLQIHAPDVPWLEMPHGAELLQVLWCPLLHDQTDSPSNGVGAPWISVRFHLDIDPLTLFTPPAPQLIEYDWFVPEPCALHPEPVTEYPQPAALDRGLAQRVEQWERDEYGSAEGVGTYERVFATAPGWKLGGPPQSSFGDERAAILCVCGAPMRYLCTVPSCEWDAGTVSWAPIEDVGLTEVRPGERRASEPTCVRVGDSQRLRIFVCPADRDHPVRSDIVV